MTFRIPGKLNIGIFSLANIVEAIFSITDFTMGSFSTVNMDEDASSFNMENTKEKNSATMLVAKLWIYEEMKSLETGVLIRCTTMKLEMIVNENLEKFSSSIQTVSHRCS